MTLTPIKDTFLYVSAYDFFNHFEECKQTVAEKYGKEICEEINNAEDFYDKLFSLTSATCDEDFINEVLDSIKERSFILNYDNDNDTFNIIETYNPE